MRAPWHALHAQLLRSTSTLRFHKQYAALVTPNRPLARFPDPAALFDYLHAPGGGPAERNAIPAALVTDAQNGAEVQ